MLRPEPGRDGGYPPAMARAAITRVVGVAAALAAIGSSFAAPAAAQQGRDGPPVLVVAHRGASKAAPEHTGPAYDLAARQGADVQECDLQVTKDEQLVCIHDTTVDRTTGGSHTGRVDSFTLAQLQEMDFGSWFEAESDPGFAGTGVVTLAEQLACYRGADPTIQFYLETKAPAEYGGRMEPLLVELLQAQGLVPEGAPNPRSSPVIVQSFDAESLAAVRALAPSLPTAFLFSVATPEIEAGTFPAVDVLAPSAPYLVEHPELIAAAHAAGKEVHTWTVDDPALVEDLIADGIDGFFTNVPDVGRQVVDAAGRSTGRRPLPDSDPSATRAPGCADGMGVGIARATTVGSTGGTTGTSTFSSTVADAALGSGTTAVGTGATAVRGDQLDPPASSGSIPILPVAIVLVMLVLAGFLVAGRRVSTRNSPPP